MVYKELHNDKPDHKVLSYRVRRQRKSDLEAQASSQLERLKMLLEEFAEDILCESRITKGKDPYNPSENASWNSQ
jgi:hypothetical protein